MVLTAPNHSTKGASWMMKMTGINLGLVIRSFNYITNVLFHFCLSIKLKFDYVLISFNYFPKLFELQLEKPHLLEKPQFLRSGQQASTSSSSYSSFLPFFFCGAIISRTFPCVKIKPILCSKGRSPSPSLRPSQRPGTFSFIGTTPKKELGLYAWSFLIFWMILLFAEDENFLY